MQNKIDRLILNANNEFTEQRNVIAALVDYSRCLDLFDIMDRTYKIQVQELFVRIAICYDILGNFNKTIEFLNKALIQVPNVSSLILYKSVLLQTLGKTDEAQKILVKYKQISGKIKMDLYETFKLVFYYSMQLEKEVLLREINEYLEKYNKNAVVLYLRAMIYLELSEINSKNNKNSKTQNSNQKKFQNSQNSEYYLKYETDLNEALQIEPHDTEFLIKDGITNENLTKLFFMILPDMDFYQPKPLVNYKSFQFGFKVFYIIFKAIKMFKIKVEKKKVKIFYSNKLKLYRKRLENSKSICDNSNYSNNSMMNPNNQSEVSTTNDKCIENSTNTNKSNKSNTTDLDLSDKITKSNQKLNHGNNLYNSKGVNKNPTIVNIKNNMEKANIDDIIKEIKKEYELKIKSLFKSVWLYNLRINILGEFNFDVDIDTNYFIKNKYYANFNLKECLITGIKQNLEYKTFRDFKENQNVDNKDNNYEHVFDTNKNNFGNILNTLNNLNHIEDKNENNFSVSEINPINQINNNVTYKNKDKNKDTLNINQDSISIHNDINLLDNIKNSNKNIINLNEIEDNKSLSNNNINSNKVIKSDKEKLKIKKISTEVIKNEVLNSKKFMHRPSPRLEGFKINLISNKLTSLSRDKKNEYSNKLLEKKITPNINQIITNPNSKDNSNNNISIENNNNNKITSNNNQNTTRQSSMRKSMEFKLIGNTKPILFKNISNLNNKLNNIIRRSDSALNGNSNINMRTNENIG